MERQVVSFLVRGSDGLDWFVDLELVGVTMAGAGTVVAMRTLGEARRAYVPSVLSVEGPASVPSTITLGELDGEWLDESGNLLVFRGSNLTLVSPAEGFRGEKEVKYKLRPGGFCIECSDGSQCSLQVLHGDAIVLFGREFIRKTDGQAEYCDDLGQSVTSGSWLRDSDFGPADHQAFVL